MRAERNGVGGSADPRRPIASSQSFQYTENMRSHCLEAAGRIVRTIVPAVFLPWYLWALAYHPLPLLWIVAGGISLLLVAISWLWPRSALLWLPAALMLFNVLWHWLPPPSVKVAYIGPAALCCAVALRSAARPRQEQGWVSYLWWLAFLALGGAALCGVGTQLVAGERAAWLELLTALRRVPLLGDNDRFVSLRYAWVWALAVATFAAVARLIRAPADIRRLAWSAQMFSVVVALFGIYSYATRRFMVSHYIYERRINATFSSPAVLADVLTLTFIAGVLLMQSQPRWRARACLIAIALLQLTALALSGCRINVLVLVLAGTAWWLWQLVRAMRTRHWRAVALSVGIMLAIIGGGLGAVAAARARPLKIPMVLRLSEVIKRAHLHNPRALASFMLAGRLDHWTAARQAWLAHPLWGIGSGLFEQRYTMFHPRYDLFAFARVHNVLLRVFTEGGVVAGIALLIALGGSIWRCVRIWIVDVAAPNLWQQYTRGICIVLLCALATSLTSDVWYENVESVLILALVCACLAAAIRHAEAAIAPSLPLEEETEVSATPLVNGHLNAVVMLASWGHAHSSRFWKTAGVLVLCVILIVGLRQAQQFAAGAFRQGALSYGLDRPQPYAKEGSLWRSTRRRAALTTAVNVPILSLSFRALNHRAARTGQRLVIYANDFKVGALALNSMEEHHVWCDISALTGRTVVLRWRADRDFQPWREGWFIDARPAAALAMPPQWHNAHPSNIFWTTRGVWFLSLSAEREWYYQQGISNANFRVSATSQKHAGNGGGAE